MWYRDAEEFKSLNGHVFEGTWYPRVTRILSVKAKPALEGFLKEMETYARAEEVKEQSAREGSLVHSAVEKLLVGERIPLLPEIAPAVRAFEKFAETRRIEIHEGCIERAVWSFRHRYAGTVDALAVIDGKCGVLDIKTSTGFYPEYNLQTAAYASALQEFLVKKTMGLSRDVETRWILRIDQKKTCERCGATLREKGGRIKIRQNGKNKNSASPCASPEAHAWGETAGETELREFPFLHNDIRAFIAAKTLWEWDNDYWLRKIAYIR